MHYRADRQKTTVAVHRDYGLLALTTLHALTPLTTHLLTYSPPAHASTTDAQRSQTR